MFAAYARHEDPTDVAPNGVLQPRLGQMVVDIPTDFDAALRVQRGISRTCGPAAFDAVKTVSLSDDPHAGTVAYRFVRHAMAANKPPACGTCARHGSCGACAPAPGAACLQMSPILPCSRCCGSAGRSTTSGTA